LTIASSGATFVAQSVAVNVKVAKSVKVVFVIITILCAHECKIQESSSLAARLINVFFEPNDYIKKRHITSHQGICAVFHKR
jgi:hypothetical protein